MLLKVNEGEPMKIKRLVIAVTFVSAIIVPMGAVVAAPGRAAGPQVDWDCELVRLQDSTGLIVYFDPRAEVTWSGKKLKYNMWSWSSRDTRKSQAAKKYGTITSNSSGSNRADLDLSTAFYYGGAESGYKKIVLKVIDSSGRSYRAQCIWKGPVAAGW